MQFKYISEIISLLIQAQNLSQKLEALQKNNQKDTSAENELLWANLSILFYVEKFKLNNANRVPALNEIKQQLEKEKEQSEQGKGLIDISVVQYYAGLLAVSTTLLQNIPNTIALSKTPTEIKEWVEQKRAGNTQDFIQGYAAQSLIAGPRAQLIKQLEQKAVWLAIGSFLFTIFGCCAVAHAKKKACEQLMSDLKRFSSHSISDIVQRLEASHVISNSGVSGTFKEILYMHRGSGTGKTASEKLLDAAIAAEKCQFAVPTPRIGSKTA